MAIDAKGLNFPKSRVDLPKSHQNGILTYLCVDLVRFIVFQSFVAGLLKVSGKRTLSFDQD
jgi:hypothetical protein